MLHVADYQERLTDKLVRCILCPHFCLVKDGMSGICSTRVNIEGKLFALSYAKPCSIGIDPIEKKPLFHFYPGMNIYSIATTGCNLRCLNCQNWEISQSPDFDKKYKELLPLDVVKQAIQNNSDSIAFTYTEPTAFFEYMLDIAKIAKGKGMKTVMISNGYINIKPLVEISKYIDAANIDLKCFDENVYKKLTGGNLQPVLDTLEYLIGNQVWLEITNLIIPGMNDGEIQIMKMCEWLTDHGFSETPIHFSRFFPNYKMSILEPTNKDVLSKAKTIAEKCGMKYVYIGNIPMLNGENTFCPDCKTLLVERSGYDVKLNRIKLGKCPDCGKEISGIWS